MKTLKRVHYLVPDNPELCVQSPYMVDENGNFYERPISVAGRLSTARQLNAGLPVINQTNNKNTAMQKYVSDQEAIKLSENVVGVPGLYRSETPAMSATPLKLIITISNAHASPQTLEIGDAAGEIKRTQGIPDKDAAVTIGGSFGTATLTQLKTLTGMMNYRLHSLNVQSFTTAGAQSTGFFTDGTLKMAYASPIGDPPQIRVIQLNDLLKADDYNSFIREVKDFRFILAPLTGLIATVPNGIKVVLTFDLHAVGLEQGMVLTERMGF